MKKDFAKMGASNPVIKEAGKVAEGPAINTFLENAGLSVSKPEPEKKPEKTFAAPQKEFLSDNMKIGNLCSSILEKKINALKPDTKLDNFVDVLEEIIKAEYSKHYKGASLDKKTISELKNETMLVFQGKPIAEPYRAEIKQIQNYRDKYLLNISHDDKEELKTFCASHSVTMNDFILYAVEYLKDDIQEGFVSVNKHGVKKIRRL